MARNVYRRMFTVLPGLLTERIVLTQGPMARSDTGASTEQLVGVAAGGTHMPQQVRPIQVRNPFEGNGAAIAQGRALFHSMNCVGCHASLGGGGIGPPLSDTTWIYGGEPGQIYLTILQGRPNGMPAFGQALPPDSVWKLVAYVRTLSQSATNPVGTEPTAKQSGKP
jgi:cytochrome c oxidase cbb3-type subunit 3